MQLSWACEEQLFRQEMENADDVRLSVRLFSKCLPDKKKVGLSWSRALSKQTIKSMMYAVQYHVIGVIQRFRLPELQGACTMYNCQVSAMRFNP